MTEDHGPRLHALSVEPRSARSGEVVRLTFRRRNLGSCAGEDARVRFLLPGGLEPLGPLDVSLGGVAPGCDAEAEVCARVAAGLDDRTELRIEALLEVSGAARKTNACALRIRTAACLDGAASGTTVEAIDTQTVRVTARVTNEGDGPACDVVLTLRAPAGCIRDDGAGPVVANAKRIEPRETFTAAMIARIVTAHDPILADDCDVAWRDGGPRGLPARTGHALAPQLVEPVLRAVPGRGRIELSVEIRNEGWADAREVPIAIALPAPLRVADGTLTIDDVRYPLRVGRGAGLAPVRITQARSPIILLLARVPARAATRMTATLLCAPDAPPATVAVRAGELAATVEAYAPAVHDIRLRLLDAPRWVEPLGSGRLAVEVFNAGDASHALAVAIESSDLQAEEVCVAVRPRTLLRVDLRLQFGSLPDPAPEGVACALVARDGEQICARLELTIAVRDRVRLALDGSPVFSGGSIAYTVRNTGTTTARSVRAEFGDWSTALDALPPGAHHAFTVDEFLARHGGLLRAHRQTLALPPAAQPARAEVEATLEGPAIVECGTAVPLRLVLFARDAIDALELSAGDPACAYVAGSTTIDGQVLAEDAGAPHLSRGLHLREVAAGSRIVVGWSLLPTLVPSGGALTITAAVRFDGDRRDLPPLHVTVLERVAHFHLWQTPGYVVDAMPAANREQQRAALTPPSPVPAAPVHVRHDVPTPAHGDAVVFGFRADWHDTARRLLQTSNEEGLLRHVLALRALFPEREFSPDGELSAALANARTALRDVFDRLFVKVRIPGFPVAAEDVEDSALRVALTGLFEAVATAPAGDATLPASGVWRRVERRAARAACDALTTAPLGSPAALRTLTLLVPAESRDDAPASAAARYAADIDHALQTCETLPLEAFDRALTSGRYATLDASRAALLAAVAARASRAVP